MIVTLFDHTRDNVGHQWKVEPSDFLTTLITAPSRLNRARKFDAMAFCGCYFDGTRAKANARDLAMVALDVDDGGADWFDAMYELSDLGAAFALYTTTKHRPDHNRYRIVLPLARPVGIDEYDALWGALARYFAARGIIIDKATTKDVAMLLGALDLFSRSPVLGGQTARGCGEVTGNFQMSDQDGTLLGVVSIGNYAPSKVEWTAGGATYMQGKA